MSQLRWTLLIVGVLFIAVLAWWERRRPRQASGAMERMAPREPAADVPPRMVREPPLTLPDVHARLPLITPELSSLEVPAARAVPLPGPAADPAAVVSDARVAGADDTDAADDTHDADDTAGGESAHDAPETDGARYAHVTLPDSDGGDYAHNAPDADGAAETRAGAAVPWEDAAEAPPAGATPEAPTGAMPPPGPVRESLPELPPAAPVVVDWPNDQERHIVAVRLVATPAERFAGRSLRQALAAEGFQLGQFAIFHKPNEERRAVLSAASLTRPGTFDLETMDSQHYGGLSLFAVLPGPKPPTQAFDELVCTARNLNERLHGVLQDEQGLPLTPARIAQLREQLRGGTTS